MEIKIAELQDWLEQDEAGSRLYRAERLAKLLAVIPEEEMVFFGGLSSAQTFTELKIAYIHGLYISTVLLALACIEQEMAGSFHMQGVDGAANARLENLLKNSLTENKITTDEFYTFDRLREIRNSYTHYRPPIHKMAWVRRAMVNDVPVDDILEADATAALSALATYLNRISTIV